MRMSEMTNIWWKGSPSWIIVRYGQGQYEVLLDLGGLTIFRNKRATAMIDRPFSVKKG